MDIESLLAPIRDGEPAGEDLRLTSTTFDELAKLASSLSVEEDFTGKGKEPDWLAVLRTATDALRTRSKDLELGAWIALAELRLREIPGLCEGLDLLVQLLERFWDHLHPGLDDGALDLEFRAKPIGWLDAQLAAPPRMSARALLGALHQIPLIPRSGARALTWHDREFAATVDKFEKDQPERYQQLLQEGRVSTAAWTAAVADASRAELRTLLAQLAQLEARVGTLNRVCVERFGEREAQTLLQTGALVSEIVGYLTAQVGDEALLQPNESQSPGAAASEDGARSGPLGSRAAAVARLGEVAEWFRRSEPHSPVSYLIERAVRWANMPFDELVRDYIKDATVQGQIWDTLGIKREE